MAPIKRKGNGPEDGAARHPKKRAKVVDNDSKKDQRKSGKVQQPAGESQISESKPRATELSALRDDEPSFPRGGASVLTPLERKQIQIEATRDVLFEQKGNKKAINDVFDDDDDEDVDMGDGAEDQTAKTKKPRKSKNSGKKTGDRDPTGKRAVRVEGLNFKRIVPGSMILGQVSSINTADVSVALPNNLTGYIPMTAISAKLQQKIESLMKEDASEDENEDSDDEDDLDLHSYFRLGQYLRVSVSSTGSDEANAKHKKRIELSVDPRQANSGLSRSDLVVDSTVQASVLSVEDHGLVMDLGIEDPDIKGFMSSREISPDFELSKVKEGTVFLCVVTGHNASGNVIKLSANLASAGSIKKSHFLTNAPTINTFLPGTAAEILLTEVTTTGMTGKIMGMLDTTVDIVHSGASSGKDDLTKKYNTGAKIKGRLVCTFPTADPLKLGFSILDHVLKFSATTFIKGQGKHGAEDLPALSAIIPEATVVNVEPGLGVYVEFESGSKKHAGFVHVSKLSDDKVENISADDGKYRLGTSHEGRIVGYNALDNLYLLSFEKKVIDQPFLRLEDVTIGAVVKGKLEKTLIGASGMDGLIVSLAEGISGLVPGMHMSDTPLQHPEKKFREGLTVSVRILSVDLEKRQIRLTLKKSLLNSASAIWNDYKTITAGNQSPGTIVSIKPAGAVVQFYGTIRGFLPVSEMSEAYIKDPSQHFRVGQVVNVHAISVDADLGKLTVSCKDPSSYTDDYKKAFEKIIPGALVTGTVFEKSNTDLLLKLDDSSLIARLAAEHLSDGTPAKNASALSKTRVGQKLQDLLVLDIQRAHRLIKASNKSSLKKASKEGILPAKFEDINEGSNVTGFVRNITQDGVFVEFLGGLTGLVPRRFVPDENADQSDFGLLRSQTITATVHSTVSDLQRFILTMRPAAKEAPSKSKRQSDGVQAAVNPVDESIQTIGDLSFGKITKAKVLSIRETQINVQLADNIQGRIDVSEVFDEWEDIKDRKQPLRFFRAKQILSVRVLGIHDARSHKFLPISHRSGKYPVFELTAKPSSLTAADLDPLNLETVTAGSSWLGFVNNIADDCLWVNLSPNVRGRVRAIDVSDDLSHLTDIEKHFPVGSALKVRVTDVDIERNRLDLSAKQNSSGEISHSDLSKGMILPGRVTKVSERQILVQLSKTVVGAISLIDMADDYSKANPASFHKNEVLRVCVVDVDVSNKKVSVSVRPSKVLSSSLPVQDPEITSSKQLKLNDVIRGFVRRVADNGLFVTLGHNVTGYVRITELSDSYLKEWKDEFQADQLVKAKIISLDLENNRIQMSLKESVLDPNYKAPVTLRDLKAGQIVTGRVRNVEEFGAFIVVDGSANVSGLCHKSEMAEQKVEDARKLFEKGDIVKAKILKIDLEKERISFSLKASYFDDEEEESDSLASDDDDDEDGESLDLEGLGGVDIDQSDDEEDDDEEEDDSDGHAVSMGGIDVTEDNDSSDYDVQMGDASEQAGGLVTGGFDWSGNANNDANADKALDSDSDAESKAVQKKKKRKAEIQVDRTGELDVNGPQTVADYERLLLGEPNSSLLWLKYMAFQLELSEVDKARQIAERALRSISIGQDTEKLNIWVAWLNLENTYGSDDSLEEVFNRACQYNDAQEIHERLISIYVQSGKTEKADELFQTALKKKFSQSPNLFLNYANFLFDTMAAPERGRALLPRALQSLPPHTHIEVTSKFGQLEFRSPSGDVERGRTVFEGLLSSFPKRVDLWIVLLDLEIKIGDKDQVRRLFERVLGLPSGSVDGSKGKKSKSAASVSVEGIEGKKKLKSKQARFLFKKWLAFEEKSGDEKMIDEVKARAVVYVKSMQGEE